MHCIIVHGDDVKRGRIRSSIRIWIFLKPWLEARALRNFVRDFPVRSLAFAQKIDSSPAGCKVAFRIEIECGRQCVASEEPADSGPLAGAGGSTTRKPPAAQ